LVNDDHERLGPAQGLGALGQLVLAGRPGGVVPDLDEGRLTYINQRRTGPVLVAELGRVEGDDQDVSPLETVRDAFSPR
jgi:hypothetical protein